MRLVRTYPDYAPKLLATEQGGLRVPGQVRQLTFRQLHQGRFLPSAMMELASTAIAQMQAELQPVAISSVRMPTACCWDDAVEWRTRSRVLSPAAILGTHSVIRTVVLAAV